MADRPPRPDRVAEVREGEAMSDDPRELKARIKELAEMVRERDRIIEQLRELLRKARRSEPNDK